MTVARIATKHQIIMLNRILVRCLCGWSYRITVDTMIETTVKDALLDAYNLHKEA